jgi:RNA polymerase sigma-70 factor (ECF subfamily)
MDADLSLVRLAQAGDQEAFAQLVRRHQRMVYHLALSKARNHHDAEEITQTAFLNAWRGLPHFQERASFSSWLYRLTANAATDFFRQNRKHLGEVSLDDPQAPPLAQTTPSPEETREAQEKQQALLRAIDALPDQAREILLLREAEDLSYQQISQALDLPVGTVRSRLARARKTLADLLRQEGNFFPPSPAENPQKSGKGGMQP